MLLQNWRYLIPLIFILTVISCSHLTYQTQNNGPKQADNFYKAGLKALQENDLVQAEIYFKQSLQPHKNFAPGLEGLARIYLARSEYLRAQRLLDRAIHSDVNWVPAYIVMSELYISHEDFDLAHEELILAQKRIKRHHLSQFDNQIQPLLAHVCFELGKFEEATAHYQRALKRTPGDKTLQLRSSLSKYYAKLLKNHKTNLGPVMRRSQISRADLALLMAEFLDSDSTNQPGKIMDLPQDVHLARAIRKCVSAGYLPVLPDQTFRPADKVDRAEMALFIEAILQKKYPFKVPRNVQKATDITMNQPFTSAVNLVLELHLMKPDHGRTFLPYAYLSGPQALAIVRRLQGFLKEPLFPTYLLREPDTQAK